MNLKNFYIRFLQKFVKVREKTIHVEAIVINRLWEKLKALIGKGYIWFVVTPTDYDYCKYYFNLKMTKEEFSNILKERILVLKKRNEEIQLHIHLCGIKEFLDKELQDKKFEEAMKFMSEIGIKPNKIATGWWKYDNYTIHLAKKYGFNIIYDFNQNPHEKPVIKNGIMIKYVFKFWHDYDFI
jgi:hypothetical protein